MNGGLFGIFLGGLVKKNQEIEKIKSIPKLHIQLYIYIVGIKKLKIV